MIIVVAQYFITPVPHMMLNFMQRAPPPLTGFMMLCAGDWWWSPLLEELQAEGSCVQADSWSLAVEANFLQTQHKDIIKQQDVIYGMLINSQHSHDKNSRIE